MKIWFDTEFIEDGKTIDLISIGMLREDGAELYIESSECDLSRADDWVKAYVLTHLTGKTETRNDIAASILEFAGDRPEFWAYYADYDWVALCQLFGRMLDLPEGWPMYCRDLKQLADEHSISLSNISNSSEHHALADARWCRDAYNFVQTEINSIRRKDSRP